MIILQSSVGRRKGREGGRDRGWVRRRKNRWEDRECRSRREKTKERHKKEGTSNSFYGQNLGGKENKLNYEKKFTP